MRNLTLSIILTCLMLNACHEPEQNITSIHEGPYIFSQDQHLDVRWLCDNKVNHLSIPVSDFPYTFSECGLLAKVRDVNLSTAPIEYQGKFKVAAFSDAHGQYDLLLQLLQNNNIIDQNLNWRFGNGHLVITGDVFDRGDKVTEILWLLFDLEQQAAAAGGHVHLLLGNHETMVLNGNLKYLHQKYQKTAELFGTSYDMLFAKDSVLGAWLRSKNVLVKINGYLFTHGGFHPEVVSDNHSLKTINQTFRDNLVKNELDEPRQGFANYVHMRKGPIWYRGYFRTPLATNEEINKLLAHFGVSNIVVGHTSQDKIETRYQGRVIAIDTSMKEGQYGEILFIDGDKHWRGDLAGMKLPL